MLTAMLKFMLCIVLKGKDCGLVVDCYMMLYKEHVYSLSTLFTLMITQIQVYSCCIKFIVSLHSSVC